MTQKTRLFDYLTANKTVTPLQALSVLGIYRLADTVFQLRKEGHQIITRMIEVRNQLGETCHVAEYVLES